MSLSFGIWAAVCAVTGLGCPEELDEIVTPETIVLEQGADGSVSLPSGLVVAQQEMRLEPVGAPTHAVNTVRLRYVSAQLAAAEFGFEQIEGDFTHLCTSFGLKARELSAPNAEEIIISIASQPTAFGETAPNVVQYFDAFKVEGDACIWEGL